MDIVKTLLFKKCITLKAFLEKHKGLNKWLNPPPEKKHNHEEKIKLKVENKK